MQAAERSKYTISYWQPQLKNFMKHYTHHYHAQMATRDLAKTLRRSQTPAENRFWFYVKNRKMLGLKFRRQHPIGKFIAYFYCHELKLVIEIDGPVHYSEKVKRSDSFRTLKINELGLTVLRFSNHDVFYNVAGIEEEVRKIKEGCSLILTSLVPLSGTTSPQGE